MLLAVGFIFGGFVGCLIMALVVASREDRQDRQRFDSAFFAPPRSFSTRNRAREAGSSWVIAGSGDVTSGSRMGTFSMRGSR